MHTHTHTHTHTHHTYTTSLERITRTKADGPQQRVSQVSIVIDGPEPDEFEVLQENQLSPAAALQNLHEPPQVKAHAKKGATSHLEDKLLWCMVRPTKF